MRYPTGQLGKHSSSTALSITHSIFSLVQDYQLLSAIAIIDSDDGYYQHYQPSKATSQLASLGNINRRQTTTVNITASIVQASTAKHAHHAVTKEKATLNAQVIRSKKSDFETDGTFAWAISEPVLAWTISKRFNDRKPCMVIRKLGKSDHTNS